MSEPTQAQIDAAAEAILCVQQARGVAKGSQQLAKAALTAAAGLGLAPGCCSAIAPCEHQRRDPTTICDTCRAAAGVVPFSERIRQEREITFLQTIDCCAQVVSGMADEMEAWTRQDYGTRLASQQLRKAAITIFALKDKP